MRFRVGIFLLAFNLWAGDADFEDTLRAGLLALNSGNLSEAQSKLEQASRLGPADPRVWLALAQTYFKSRQLEKAGQAAQRAGSIAPRDPVVARGLAIYYAEAENWAEAAKWEARHAQAVPADPESAVRAVSFFLRAGKAEDAVETAEQALEHHNRAELQILLAQAYETLSQTDKAILALEEAIRLRPYEERYYFEFAHFLLRRQQFDRAVNVLLRGKKVFDKSPQLELLMGISYYGQRKFEQAVDSFLRTIDLAPGMEQPHAFLGRILTHAHDRIDEVTAKFAAFYRAQPDSYLGPYLYAKALVASMGPSADPEVIEKAEALLRQSLERKEDFWGSHFVLGRLLEKKRDYTGAEKHLLRSIELNPDDSRPHYRLARVYTRLSKKDAAQREMELHAKLVEEERQAMRGPAMGSDGAGGVVE